jgi:ribulose-5-phosphate 4-epimerase/fuculose-1-phosphate aldolase
VTTAVKYEAPATGAAAFSPDEWKIRVELAACYRIFDHLGWIEMIFNHITMRVPGPEHHFLINPFGLHYSEVTASNLVKIDLDGKIVGRSDYPVNPAGFVIHSAIHAAVPDALCIIHTHTTAGLAVASSKTGLTPTNRYSAAVIHETSYHDFEGPSVHDDEKPRLVRDLGTNRAMILRNHGLLCHGRTIPEAFMVHFRLQRACEIQTATSVIDPGIPIPSNILAISREVSGDPNLAREIFDAMVREVDKIDDSYKN